MCGVWSERGGCVVREVKGEGVWSDVWCERGG